MINGYEGWIEYIAEQGFCALNKFRLVWTTDGSRKNALAIPAEGCLWNADNYIK
jgi:hypothetical protein